MYSGAWPREMQSLLRPTRDPYDVPPPRRGISRGGLAKFAAMMLASVSGLALIAGSVSTVAHSESPLVDAAMSSKPGVGVVPNDELVLTSEYERRSGRLIGDGMYPWHVAEVARPMQIELNSGDAALWHVHHADFPNMALYDSHEPEHKFEFVFQSLGTHQVMAARSTGGDLLQFTVESRLVRREISGLSDTDRERYLAALHHIYTIDDFEGQRRWGSSFKSAAWFVREHLYGAAQRNCDHWHDDAGFLNHHVGITWQLEQALHAIDAGVAAHYWDYTKTAEAVQEGSFLWHEAPIFQDEWFGAIRTNSSDEHVVSSGRWAYTPVMSNARGYSNITNPFGLLRSPWNTNPAPYLTRGKSVLGVYGGGQHVPTCDAFKNTLTSSSSMGYYMQMLNDGLHGPVHIMIGGHWHYSHHKFPKVTKIDGMTSWALLSSKFMWRQGFVRCPETCGSGEECKCSCPSEIRNHHNASYILEKAGIIGEKSVNGPTLLGNWEEDTGTTADELLDFLCQVGHAGEMFTSAAPQDPTFWPLHGLAERYVQYVRLLKSKDVLSVDETWQYTHAEYVPSDTGVVCDWSDTDELGMPTCRSATCEGHRANDVLPFDDLIANQTFTNAEFYDMIHPYSHSLPYVYDTLSYWPACTDETIFYFDDYKEILKYNSTKNYTGDALIPPQNTSAAEEPFGNSTNASGKPYIPGRFNVTGNMSNFELEYNGTTTGAYNASATTGAYNASAR